MQMGENEFLQPAWRAWVTPGVSTTCKPRNGTGETQVQTPHSTDKDADVQRSKSHASQTLTFVEIFLKSS